MVQAFPHWYDIYMYFNVKVNLVQDLVHVTEHTSGGTMWSVSPECSSFEVFFVTCSYSGVTRLVGIEWPLPLNQASNITFGRDSPTGSVALSVAAVRTQVQICHKEAPFKHIPLYGAHYDKKLAVKNNIHVGSYITFVTTMSEILHGTFRFKHNIQRNITKIKTVSWQK